MKKNHKSLAGVFLVLCLFIVPNCLAQAPMTSYPVNQQDPRIRVSIFYQKQNDALLGAFTQDYKIVVQNLTNDKLHIEIDYYANLTCGQKDHKFGPLSNGATLKPGELMDRSWLSDGHNTYQRLIYDSCPKSNWREMGTDKNGNKLYSIINSLGYNIIKITNLSEEERKKEDEKKKEEIEAKNKKLEEEKKKKENEDEERKKKNALEDQSTTNNTEQNSNDDFWSDGTNKSQQSSNSTKNQSSQEDDKLISASDFKNNLRNVKEGDYFEDGAGGYYQRTSGGAERIDKRTYEQNVLNKTMDNIRQQQAESRQRDEQFKQDWDNFSTSFYAKANAEEGLRDASRLDGNYETIEELNAAFSQKLRDIRVMGSELQQASTQAIQAYSTTLSNANPSGYDYSGTVSMLGALGSAIAANSEAKKAREELQRERDRQEAEIKARQLQALLAIRSEIGKAFEEGGMPLSSHKVDAPVLYLFAYQNNKTDWNKNQEIPMAISNVIPVYRYSDGSYPYTSNVKRTFENAGITNPALVGYFTNKKEAERYRNSLIDVAPNAKFILKDIQVKVKEQSTNTNVTSSNVDFWGNAANKDKPKKETKETETDFWGQPTNKTTKPEKEDEKKKDDFWGN